MSPRNSARFRSAGRASTLASAAVLLAMTGLAPALAQAPAEVPAPAPAPGAPVAPAAPNPEEVVGYVNGEAITQADVTVAGFALRAELEGVPLVQRRDAAMNMLVTLKLVADQAASIGLDQATDFQNRMEFYRRQALRDVFVNEFIIGRVDDAMLQSCYDNLTSDVSMQEEVRASHILVASEPEALDVIAQLRAGADFAELATRLSTDPTARDNGGDLGFFGRGQMVPAFEQAAFALEPGAITEQPVQTQFGWHVIKAEERRTTPPPPFDEVKSQVEQIVWGDLYRAWVDALTDGTTFTPLSDITGDPPAPAPVAIDELDPYQVVDCLMVADASATPAVPAAPEAPAPAPTP